MTTFSVVSDLGGWAAAWMLTYLLQSSLLLGAAWLLSRSLLRSEAWREAVWRTALLGGLVTTAASGLAPGLVELRIPLPSVAFSRGADGALAPVAPASAPADEASSSSPAGTTAPRLDEAAPGGTGGAAAPVADDADGALPAAASSAGPRSPGRSEVDPSAGAGAAGAPSRASAAGLLALRWLVVAGGLLGRVVLRQLRLRRLLRGRRTVTELPLQGMLSGLCRSTGFWHPVRLSATPAVATPLVLGRREICVPERFLADLGPEEQKAALAHELAHLVRRDGAWHLLAQLLEALFFFQPLHRVARLRLRESAEYLADAWAVRHTGSRLELARCLSEVAGWIRPSGAPDLAGHVAMAEGGSPLLARVRRLLDGEPEGWVPAAPRVAAAVALIGLTGALAPSVTAARMAEEHSVTSDAAVLQVVEVVRVAPGGTLGERIATVADGARAEAGAGYWLAWVFESTLGPGDRILTSSGQGDWNVSSLDRPGLEQTLGVAAEVGRPGSGDLLVLARATGRGDGLRIQRLALASPGIGMDLGGRPVYWLGRAPADESLGWAHALYLDERQHASVRDGAIDLLARHPLSRAQEILAQIVGSSAARGFREEAVEGLESHPSEETVELLLGLASSDSDGRIRAEAAETLGEVEHPAASAALATLLREPSDLATREEALEALVERRDTLLAEVLLEVALTAPDAELRMEAAEQMAELPPDEALPLLRRVLEASTEPRVRMEAVEALADIRTTEAAAALEALVESETDGAVAVEAVEALAELGSALAAGPLERFARSHPLPAVREEAMDRLVELGDDAVTGPLLMELALTAGDRELSLEAVEQMEDMAPAEAVPALRRIAFEAEDRGVRRQAAETLGEMGTAEALQVLDDLAWESDDEAVALQAVESMEEYPAEASLPILRRIVMEHPSRRVRQEAFDVMNGDAAAPRVRAGAA